MKNLSSTEKGRVFEDKVFKYFSSLLESNDLPNANQKYSKIFQLKKYKTDTSREIVCDISIENYNPFSSIESWSTLIVIECKNYSKKVDISDLDEFQSKLNNISHHSVKGIMVTTVGYSSSIIEKAIKEHIGLIVFSDNQYQWLVNRDIYYEPEYLMLRLQGKQKLRNQPVVYFNSKFYNIINVLEEFGTIISKNHQVTLPYIDDEELEKLALSIYNEYLFKTNEIASEVLVNKFPQYRINFEEYEKGVLGTISIDSNVITLSNEIKNDVHRRNFTIAHEIAHLLLHLPIMNTFNKTIEYENENISPIVNEKFYRGMEIQANKFAGYLLVPTGPLKNYFRIILKNLSIYKESLILDNQPCNKELVNSILVQLSNIFNVSCEVIKYRLEQEKLLAINQNSPQRIRNIMRQ